ncbi:MAG: 2-iminoacetate synthase ThiH [Candidatus Margulisiibacteriota bacterium]
MLFDQQLQNLNISLIEQQTSVTTDIDIETLLAKDSISYEEFLLLLSPAAACHLEPMAIKARQLTAQHFGRTIQLYVPVYLSNECHNQCLYCGFNHSIKQQRITLTPTQMQKEFEAIKQQGFDQVLLLTGEAPQSAGIDYLVEAVKLARKYFTQVSLEIFPASTQDYGKLVASGASGLTIYQETFDREIYAQVHPKGKKSDYGWRLDTPDRALSAGFRKLGIGVLLGLADWQRDIAALAYQGKYLLNKYWQSALSISFPRMHYTPDGYTPHCQVTDRELLQIIFALRIFLPEIGLVLSTREPAQLRDNLIGFGITQISAGSKTNPGGYQELDTCQQFTVEDQRELHQVITKIKEQGYDPVLKDWDPAFEGIGSRDQMPGSRKVKHL